MLSDIPICTQLPSVHLGETTTHVANLHDSNKLFCRSTRHLDDFDWYGRVEGLQGLTIIEIYQFIEFI